MTYRNDSITLEMVGTKGMVEVVNAIADVEVIK